MALNIEIQNENKIIMNIWIYAFATTAQKQNPPKILRGGRKQKIWTTNNMLNQIKANSRHCNVGI